MLDHPYAEFLTRVSKPSRYVGGEVNQVEKDWDGVGVRLVLAFPDLHDVGMSHLAGLVDLEVLIIGGSQLTDKALSYLARMSKLNQLRTTGDFGDDGLRHLEANKALEYLYITSDRATSDAARERLKKKLRNVKDFDIVP